MLSWLAPVLVFGLVVLVHEVGHFVAAKLVGVYAPRFSIGFGRVIWRRRRGETEYVLGLLPLGGYVRMASREDETMAMIEGGGESPAERPADWDPEAMQPFGPKEVPAHRWFESKPLSARLFILGAGVVMNAILALTINIGIFAANPRLSATTVIDSVVVDRPAYRAGLLRGDSIVAVNGKAITAWGDMVAQIRAGAGVPLQLEVRRARTVVTVTVTPDAVAGNPELGDAAKVGQIGVLPRAIHRPVTVGYAVSEGWDATVRMGSMVVGVVGGLFSGRVSVTQLGGPIAIAKSSVAAAQNGAEVLLSLIAFLSINVAVLNLLPIPILDGGQILLNVIESAKGSAFSTRTREYILRAGLLAIALLFALVMFNDLGLRRLFG
jgi:regulator of sigma E protease